MFESISYQVFSLLLLLLDEINEIGSKTSAMSQILHGGRQNQVLYWGDTAGCLTLADGTSPI